jgi:WD40 repeat protein
MLELLDLATGQEIRTMVGHDGGVNCLAVTSDGRWAVSGGDDMTLKIWDLESGRCCRTIQQELPDYAGSSPLAGKVTDLAVVPSGRLVASLSIDCPLRVWDMDSGDCLGSMEGVGPIAAGDNFIVAGNDDGGEVLFLKLMPPGRIVPETMAESWHPSRLLLAVARANGSILVQEWHSDSQHLEELARTASSRLPIERLQWSSDGAHLRVVARNGTQRILDASTLHESFAPAPSWAKPRDISPDGLWLAVIRDGRLEVVPATDASPAPVSV